MHCLSFFLCVHWKHNGFFPFHRKFHLTKAWLKNNWKGLHKEGLHSFNLWILIISWPWALLGSRLFIIFIMLSFDIWTLLRRFSVRNSKFFGSLLLFFGSEHYSAKNVLKSLAFPLKFIANLLSWNTAGLHGIFLSFKNVFNIDH